jgi:hypothetical protein
MSDRKNIDRLFQEKFKDFEVPPSEEVWGNIEAKLDGKKKRRVIPFWWKLSGVAAVFLIGFLVSKSIYDDGAKTGNPIVNENNVNKTRKTNPGEIDSQKNNGAIHVPNDSGPAKENPVASQTNSAETKENNVEGINKAKGAASTAAVATTSEEVKNNTAQEEKNRNGKTAYSSKSAVAERKPSHRRSLKNKAKTHENAVPVTESIFGGSQNQVAQNTKKNDQPATNNNQSTDGKQPGDDIQANQITQTGLEENNKKETPTSVDKKNINLDDLKGNVNSKIATKEIEKKVNDTVPAKNSVANNELEELLNEKESKLKKGSKRNRWQLASNVAPIFLGSVSNGSPIDSTLSKNSKSYNTNVGFGVAVSYAVNDKFSIRTGLNKVNMSYDTNNISFFSGIQAKTLQAVSPTATSAMIHVESSAGPASNLTPETELLPFENSFVHKNSGYLRQEMGYLEMPVEMTYNLLDKKFGLKIIGGFSTLLLQDNSIMIISEGMDTYLGEANNLNDVHFSTNLGLGVKYSFLKSFEFNIEPTVKYQLNTYSSNAGNFKPYLFGIYSGISYKF